MRNPEGLGPATTVVVMTDEGVPSAPLNVSTHSITNTSVTVTWEQPSDPNGVIEGYRYTDIQTWVDIPSIVNDVWRVNCEILPKLR